MYVKIKKKFKVKLKITKFGKRRKIVLLLKALRVYKENC